MKLNPAGPRLPEPSEHKLLLIGLCVALVLWLTTGAGVAV